MTKLITTPAFAQRTGLSYGLCLQLVGTGQIPFVPVGRRRIDVRWEWTNGWPAVDIARTVSDRLKVTT